MVKNSATERESSSTYYYLRQANSYPFEWINLWRFVISQSLAPLVWSFLVVHSLVEIQAFLF
jgi:hypothetical protein